MSGISITAKFEGFDQLMKKLRPVLDFDPTDLMTAIGALGESQTRRRITDEKTAPDGTAWPENWFKTPILVQSGQHLLASVAFNASASEAEWGASWEYAHVHQFGAVIKPVNGSVLKFWFVDGGSTNFAMAKQVTIPARPFVGLSADNEAEILDLVTDHFGVLS